MFVPKTKYAELTHTEIELGSNGSPRPTLAPSSSRRTKTVIGTIRRNWRTSRSNTARDGAWRYTTVRIFAKTWPLLIILSLVAGIAVVCTHNPSNYIGSFCELDGTFDTGSSSNTYTYNPWQMSEFFTINLGFGSFNFATAKAIDILWDVCIGRLGQATLAFVSYKVCTRAISRVLGNDELPYDSFRAITLEHGSFLGTARIIRDFSTLNTANTRLVIFWIVYSTISVWVFPILTGAMTGYSASLVPFVSSPNGTRLPVENFNQLYYVVHDGSRLGSGFSDEHAIYEPANTGLGLTVSSCLQGASGLSQYEYCRQFTLGQCSSTAPGSNSQGNFNVSISWVGYSDSNNCDDLWRVSKYAYNYGLGGSRNVSSKIQLRGQEITLEGPVLNITAYTVFYATVDYTFSNNTNNWAIMPYGTIWQATGPSLGPQSPGDDPILQRDYTDVSPRYIYQDTLTTIVYNETQMMKHGVCQKDDSDMTGPIRYRWGFSYQLLLCGLVLVLIWVVGMYALYLDTILRVHPALDSRDMGSHRAVMDLAIEYQDRLSGAKADMKGDTVLAALIGRGKITYRSLLSQSQDGSHDKNRIQRLRIWWWTRTRFTTLAPLPPWRSKEDDDPMATKNFPQWARQEKYWLFLLFVFLLLMIVGLGTPDSWGQSWSSNVSWIPCVTILGVLMIQNAWVVRALICVIPAIVVIAVESWVIHNVQSGMSY